MSQGSADPSLHAESSLALLERAKAGDRLALDVLMTRYRPRLVRWVRKRLPPAHRDLSDTEDLVQNTLIKVVRNLEDFSAESGLGLQHYLRTALRNAIRDEIKKSGRRPVFEPIEWSLPGNSLSPLEEAETRQRLARYESALMRLEPDERDAVIARLELGFTHEELAAALGKATPDAARKLCRKAITRLVALLGTNPAS